jgi:RNA polymerase sigma-70 factor (ECF subfamily)
MASGPVNDVSHRWSGLMAAAQEGDAEAYRALLEEIMPVVRGMVLSRVYDRAAAEDVVQNVLLSVHRARHTYRSERPFKPWLAAIARNAIIDSFRGSGRRRDREIEVELIDAFADPVDEGHPDEREVSPHLLAAIERLPAKLREAVVLLQIEGLSVAEAADRAGVSAGALKVRAHRGYKALRRDLGSVTA